MAQTMTTVLRERMTHVLPVRPRPDLFPLRREVVQCLRRRDADGAAAALDELITPSCARAAEAIPEQRRQKTGDTMPAIDYAAFRRELEDFARKRCPPEIRAVVAAGQKVTKREYQRWQKILHARGLGRAELAARSTAAPAGTSRSA